MRRYQSLFEMTRSASLTRAAASASALAAAYETGSYMLPHVNAFRRDGEYRGMEPARFLFPLVVLERVPRP